MPPRARVAHPSVDERRARGKAGAERTPLSGHAGWAPAADRPDPVGLLEAQNPPASADLVPVRHGRMMVSPFTFYRGAAKIMAADLKDTPTAGLTVQLCGDAHLSNFGVFASPERTLVFDLNDFDETLPGPFEYDVKRLAASFTIAARNNGFTKARRARGDPGVGGGLPGGDGRVRRDGHDGHLVRAPVRGRRPRPRAPRRQAADAARSARKKQAPRRPSGTETDAPQGRQRRPARATACRRCPSSPSWSTASTGSSASHRSCPGARPARPPTAFPVTTWRTLLRKQFRAYRATLQRRSASPARTVPGRRHGPQGRRRRQRRHPGLHRPAPGSRRARPALPAGQGGNLLGAGGPPARSRYPQHGQRVVHGQRMMQAASDIYLGWTKGRRHQPPLLLAPAARHEGLGRRRDDGAHRLAFYARACGWTLARAHARSGDPIAIAAYLGERRSVRPVDHRLRRALRRPERAGLPGVRRGDPVGTTAGTRRRLRVATPSRLLWIVGQVKSAYS